MQKYELLYIIPAKYTEDEVKGLTDKIGMMISNTGGTIEETKVLGRRKFAYEIDHIKNGYYIMVNFEAEQAAIEKMDKTLRLSPDLMRHLLVKKDPKLTKVPEFAESGEIVQKKTDDSDQKKAPRVHRAPVKEKEKLTMKDLDKKIDDILTEEIK